MRQAHSRFSAPFQRESPVRLAFPLLVAAALFGCAPPRLDSNDLDGSAAKVRRSVDEERRIAFDEAFQVLREASRGEVAGTAAFSVDGMNAAAVFDEAERIDIRREISWFEEAVQHNRQVLDTAPRLAKFEVTKALFDDRQGDGRLHLALTVHNGLEQGVTSGWLITRVGLDDGSSATSSDYVAFDGVVAAGSDGEAEIVVSGDAARYLTQAQVEQVSYRFSSLERGGETLVEEPPPETEARARAGVAEAQSRLAELEKRLAFVGSER